MEVVDYVLGKYGPEDRDMIEQVYDLAATACVDWIRQGTLFAMNRYNAEQKK